MRKPARFAGLTLLAAASFSAHAETIDLNLNDEAVRGVLSGPLNRLFSGTEGEYQAGALFSDDKDINLTQLHAGVLATGDTGAQEVRLNAGVGLRAQYTDTKPQNGGGLEVGGQFDLRFAGFERLGLQGYAWYQPKVLTLGDLQDQFEWALTGDYQILKNASLYLGYRRLRINFEHAGTYTADSGAIFGLRLKF